MQLGLEQSSQWLEGNPDQAFVRWAAIGLAGLLLPLARSEEPVVRDLIEKSAEWLKTPAAKEDRLVRMGLWLVGAYGNPAQVRRATPARPRRRRRPRLRIRKINGGQPPGSKRPSETEAAFFLKTVNLFRRPRFCPLDLPWPHAEFGLINIYANVAFKSNRA